MGLSHHTVGAVLAVSDLEQPAFYEGGLGLTPGRATTTASRIRAPTAPRCSSISRRRTPAEPGYAAGWAVDDLDAIMAELAARGVVFEQYDQPGIKTDARGVFDAGPFRAAWMKDPDGNTLAMTERATTTE